MDKTKIAELEAVTATAKTAADAAEGNDEALNKVLADAEAALAAAKTSPDPIADALEKEQKRTKRTETEKAEYSLRSNAERAKALGLDPAKVLGFTAGEDAVLPDSDDDDKPLTRGEFRRMETERASKSALQMADEIEDENERNLTKEYLKRVVPSGNPAEDLQFARLAVNSIKSGQILEEVARRGRAPAHGTGSGGPARGGENNGTFVPTSNEAKLMKPPFNLTQADVLKARQQSEQK